MSDAPRDAGVLIDDGTCMAFEVTAGPRCVGVGAYVADTVLRERCVWCAEHAAVIRDEHPEFVLKIRTYRRG